MLFIDFTDVMINEIWLAPSEHATSVSLKNPSSISIAKSPKQCFPPYSLLSVVSMIYIFFSYFRPSLWFSSCVCQLQAVVCPTWFITTWHTGLSSFSQQSERDGIYEKRTSILLNKYAYSKPTNHSQSWSSYKLKVCMSYFRCITFTFVSHLISFGKLSKQKWIAIPSPSPDS